MDRWGGSRVFRLSQPAGGTCGQTSSARARRIATSRVARMARFTWATTLRKRVARVVKPNRHAALALPPQPQSAPEENGGRRESLDQRAGRGAATALEAARPREPQGSPRATKQMRAHPRSRGRQPSQCGLS